MSVGVGVKLWKFVGESRRESVCAPRGALSVYDFFICLSVSTNSETEAVTKGKFLIAKGDRDQLALTLSSTSPQLESCYSKGVFECEPMQ